MKLGAYTACLHDKTLVEAMDILTGMNLDSIELNAGGFLPTPHIPVDSLLASATARREYLALIADHGMELTGLNVNGNPLDPDPQVGGRQARDLRNAIDLAGLLGVGQVVAMSGNPGAEPRATVPSWVVEPWQSAYTEVLDYQWSEVAVPFWTDIESRARRAGVHVCVEMHPHNLVYNPATLERLIESVGATHIGAEMDPSHLFWQGIEPTVAIKHLGDRVFHAAAKDVRINTDNCRLNGVLDNRFRTPAADEPQVELGGRYVLNEFPENPSWQFVAVGRGHDMSYWSDFLTTLYKQRPEIAVNIEHEDTELGQIEGLSQAADTLTAANKQ